jgi:hypothetical protein
MLKIDVEHMKREQADGRRPDSPLGRVLIAVYSNLARLEPDVPGEVYEQVSAVAGRPWSEISKDLDLTRAWRRSIPVKYSPMFDVKRLPFRNGGEARIQVTADNKVMLRSLIEAAGLAGYKTDIVRDYVPVEQARSSHTPGRKALFARAEDLIPGIDTMQRERRKAKLKVDPEWEQILGWLVNTFGSTGG